MRQALGSRVAPSPTARPNPQGPVEPLDVPTVEDIPLGDGSTTLDIDPNGVNISGAIEGVPVGVRIDRQGVRIDTPRPSPTATATAQPQPLPAN